MAFVFRLLWLYCLRSSVHKYELYLPKSSGVHGDFYTEYLRPGVTELFDNYYGNALWSSTSVYTVDIKGKSGSAILVSRVNECPHG